MFKNWILQDLPHVFPPRSLQTTVGTTTTSFHTGPIKNRKFWNLFEFSSKENNTKNAKKLSESVKDDNALQDKNILLNDASKNMVAMSKKVMMSPNKVYSSKLMSNNYTFRYVTRTKSNNKIKNSKSNNFHNFDEFTSLLDGNYVPTNIKYKLKGNKTLKNEQVKDFAFVPGNKSLDLDIMSSKNVDKSVSNKLSKPNVSKKFQRTKSHNQLKTNVLFPCETKVSKITSKERQKFLNNSMTDQKQSKTATKLEGSTLVETKETENKTLLRLENPEDQIKSQVETKNNESQVQQLEDQNNQKTTLQSSKENLQNISMKPNPTRSLSNSLNRTKTVDNLKYSSNSSNIKETSASYSVPRVLSISERADNNSQRDSSSVRNLTKDNPAALEAELRSSNKIPRYSMYESRMEQQRRASTSPCAVTFVKAQKNSTKQRWSGFDRAATGCCPARSSGSHGSRSQGSTRPYPPTVQTREVSSKCYTREKDPIARSNILSSDRKILKTRNSVTTATISTTNIINREVYSKIQPKRIFLGSKSSTGLIKNLQSFSYGSCNKSKKSCNDKSSCCKKKKKNECDQMIPGKVICIKPKKDCSKPKRCRSEKKICCTEKKPPPPPPPPPPLRSSCCKSKCKKKKVCKRYCCPELQVKDCIVKRGTCPTKRDKCQNDYVEEHDDDQEQKKRDPTCLPIEKPKQQKYDCTSSKDENDCFSPTRDICTTPKKCSSRSQSCTQEKDDDCLEDHDEQREICTKPKKKDCCNSKRSSRRSNSCNNRHYHSETKSSIRKTKSSVTIPMFDVSVVLLRPYQNDAVLRFYSSCGSSQKPPSSCEDPCKKKKCQKPEPQCLNKKRSEESICGKPKEDICTKPKEDSCAKPKEDPCAKPTKDPCGFKQRESTCGTPKTDICGSSKGIKDDQDRLKKELQEMQICKGKKKSTCKKTPDFNKDISNSCKKNKCNKFESIDLKEHDNTLGSSTFKLSNLSVPFCLRPTDSSLLNFGMKPDNIITNRSFSTTKITKDICREELPVLIETEPAGKEWDDEESSSYDW